MACGVQGKEVSALRLSPVRNLAGVEVVTHDPFEAAWGFEDGTGWFECGAPMRRVPAYVAIVESAEPKDGVR